MNTKNATIPILSIGFRPLFLLGSTWSVLSMLYWLGSRLGFVSASTLFPSFYWHAHEMIFGFATVFVIGFLLTASANWSGRPALKGPKLGLLSLVWILGRVSPFILPKFLVLTSLIDLSFIPLAIYCLWPTLNPKIQKKNVFFQILLSFLFISNLMMHLSFHQIIDDYSRAGYFLGLNLILLVIIIIAGRVVPFFTGKVIPNARTKKIPFLEKLCIVSFSLVTVSLISPDVTVFSAVCSLVAGLALAARFFFWWDHRIFKTPILLVLYVSFLWIICGMLMQGLGYWFHIPRSVSLHFLTVGGVGLMILGISTRVSLGHTGRALVASPVVIFSYVVLTIAAVIRTLVPLVCEQHADVAIIVSGTLWIFSFLIYVVYFFPILIKPRAS